jgi:hypothetical protein
MTFQSRIRYDANVNEKYKSLQFKVNFLVSLLNHKIVKTLIEGGLTYFITYCIKNTFAMMIKVENISI